ncbi:Porin subfamily protein [Phyllobacterium sp. YR620]|uniref:porin n=1 Tax=Phyllobacterium sp. YR620 TaxID=1881066 RepID=UPI0008918BBC|nr:porin [Phyllobacterium sp. YR620]SDP11813.1 Porin subfamily protein [Phyllobacterium sp. YR620]
MAVRTLLFSSVAAIITTSAAYAADAVVVAEPEPVEYVRVCDAYGKGFFYLPGTETCLKVNGYLRVDVAGGDDPYTGGHIGGDDDTWYARTRAEIRFDARSETELGTLRSFADTRFQFTNGSDGGASLHQGYIELGGFQIGVNDVLFGSWLGYAGEAIIQDDVIQYGSDSLSSNQVSYTFKGGNGFSAIVAAEQGEEFNGYDYVIDDYMPHVLAGVKLQQGWGQIGAVVGYDSVQEDVGVKARLDVSLTDSISAWIMAGYQSDYDSDSFNTNQNRNWYGLWEGDWAGWGGFAVKVTEKATINGQAAYEEQGTWALALNVNYELVPGFIIRPEIDYTKFGGARKEQAESEFGDDDAIGGIVRFQRNF